MDYPLDDFGGTGDVLHLAVANGFPALSYTPLIDALKPHFQVLHLLPRPMWPTDEAPPRRRLNWKHTIARDLIDGIQVHDLRDVVAVGHSFGGIASILAALALPDRFRALILLDPTILPGMAMWYMRVTRWLNRDNPLARGADRRRDHFEGRESAYERLRSKGLFRDWDEAAFRGYIDAMKPDAERGGVTLGWPRAWEAYYFRTLYADTWRDLPKLRGKLPVMTIRGGTSDTLTANSAAVMRSILPQMTYHEIDGHGHLFPHSAPIQTAELILSWLDAQG